VIDIISGGLQHWKTGQILDVQDGNVLVKVDGKTIDIFCRDV
jgi:hypothetical protein